MANNSGLSKRAALRQQQELEERRKRNARILGFGLGAVAVAVVVILAVVIFQTMSGNSQQSAEQQIPPNATADSGIEVVSTGTEAAADAPHVIIYEDFQCPACAARAEAYGPPLYELVDAGNVTVEYRLATFMEEQLRNDSSTRPAQASAAADAVGKFREYHAIVFANQSPQGRGYTDEQLRVQFPEAAGITGEDLTKFQELYDTGAFADFVKDMGDQFRKDGIESTPTYVVGDTKLEFFNQSTQEILIQPTADDLLRAITEANS